MKYIDAEKLISEIEKRKNILDVESPFGVGGRVELELVLDAIASLQQEQPDNEDIDKVAQELYEHLYELKRRNNVPTNLYDKQEIIDLWKAGIEYGRNHPKQEQREVDLENYLENYFKGWRIEEEIGLTKPDGWSCIVDDLKELARHFYELGLNARKEN